MRIMADTKVCQVYGAENPPNARYRNQCRTFLDIASGPAESGPAEERRR